MPSVRPPPADFLPGTLVIERGVPRDYRALERFHYAAKRPATWAGVWVARYYDDALHTNKPARGVHVARVSIPCARLEKPCHDRTSRIVAVGVLSYPYPRCLPRERFLGLPPPRAFADHVPFLNAHVRTISRVIVHPQFRALGLAGRLIRRMLDECPTRYIEALAVMARVHPMFDAAGMTRIDPAPGDERTPVYFIFDKEGASCE